MIKPKRLSVGDTIAFISLSSGLAGELSLEYRWKLAKERLENMGFKIEITPNALKSNDFLYQHPELRAKDLMDALRDPKINGVICMIGGSDTIRLLPYIDFNVIRDNPKVFIGYSDATVNHFMFYHAGVSSIYGPCAMVEFAENVSMHPYTLNNFKKLSMSNETPINIEPSFHWTSEFLDWNDYNNSKKTRKLNTEKYFYEFLQGKGIVSGNLLGGCIETFPMLICTKLWPKLSDWKNKVLFLETSELLISPSMLTIMLRGLAAQGIFHQINGILFGKPVNETYYEEYKNAIIQVVHEECKLFNLPIVFNMNFGHTAPIMSLPFGCNVEINCDSKTVGIKESPVT